MKLGNYEFPEIIGRDDGKLYVCPFTTADGVEIVPVISSLKGSIMPVALQAYQKGALVKVIGLPPNNQQDLDEWNFLTKQGLAFEDMPSRYASPRAVVDVATEILTKIEEVKQLIQAK